MRMRSLLYVFQQSKSFVDSQFGLTSSETISQTHVRWIYCITCYVLTSKKFRLD